MTEPRCTAKFSISIWECSKQGQLMKTEYIEEEDLRPWEREGEWKGERERERERERSREREVRRDKKSGESPTHLYKPRQHCRRGVTTVQLRPVGLDKLPQHVTTFQRAGHSSQHTHTVLVPHPVLAWEKHRNWSSNVCISINNVVLNPLMFSYVPHIRSVHTL